MIFFFFRSVNLSTFSSAEAHRSRHLLWVWWRVYGLRDVVSGFVPDGQNACYPRWRPRNGENLPLDSNYVYINSFLIPLPSAPLSNPFSYILTQGYTVGPTQPEISPSVCQTKRVYPPRSRSCVSVSWPGSIRPYSEPMPYCRNRKEAFWMQKWKQRYTHMEKITVFCLFLSNLFVHPNICSLSCKIIK